MNKVYFYIACINIPNKPYEYFKANNKKQIKKYLTDSYISFDLICDPTNEPVEAVHYIDVTHL